MMIAENFNDFVDKVSEAERTAMKLAQNPNMTPEEWAQTKSEFMTFMFAVFVREVPEAMQELGHHVYNELQEAN